MNTHNKSNKIKIFFSGVCGYFVQLKKVEISGITSWK